MGKTSGKERVCVCERKKETERSRAVTGGVLNMTKVKREKETETEKCEWLQTSILKRRTMKHRIKSKK